MKYFAFLIISLSFCTNSIYSQGDISLYSSGMENFNKGNYSNAISFFEQFVSSDEIDNKLLSSSKIYIAESLLGLEQVDGAISKFESFVSEFPTSNFRELALYRLGNLYFEKKLYDKSRTNLVELVESYPESEYAGSSYHLIGEAFIEENDFEKAERFFSSAVNSKKNNSFVDYSMYSLANLFETKGQYTKAVNYYDKILGYHKGSDLSAQAQLRIGICYFYLMEYDNAVLELSDPLIQDLDIDQQNEADYILANTFYRLAEYESSREAYKRILNNSPSSEMLDRIRYGLAWINFQEGNYKDAYKMFNLLSQSKDDSVAVKSLYWSGESKRYDGKYGESIEIHKNFVSKYPNHPYSEKVILNIGISIFSQNSLTESEESLLESTNSSDPLSKAKALTLLGEINLRKKEYKKSLEFFKRGLYIPQIPNELKDRCNLGLGVANFFMKNNIEALNNFNSVNETGTKLDNSKLNFYKGEANFFLGNYADAISNYNKVSSEDEKIQKNSLYGKAYSYFNLKDFTKASHYFNQYLNRFQDDEFFNECQLRLADCYFGSKSFGKASLYYERALSNSTKLQNTDRALFNYAQSLFKLRESAKAIRVLNNLQTRFPASKYADESQYLIGWINFQNGKFEDAINSYSKLDENYPETALLPIALYSVGDSYFNLGEYKSAISSYDKVLTKFPNSSYVYDAVNGIQYCYVVQDKQTEAINYLNDFILKNEHLDFMDKIQFKKGEILYSSGSYKLAIGEYEILIENYPQSPLVSSSYFWMGKSALLLEKLENAASYFKVVINNSLNTEVGFSSVLELGKIYRKQKNFSEETQLYDDVLLEISDSKQISEINYVKAQSYIENNDIPSAYQVLSEIVDKRDGSLFYYKSEIELGILELARSNYDNSLYLLKDVLKNREDDLAAKANYYVGLNYFEQEKLPEAITELIKVRSLYSAYDEWYSKSLMLLGDSYVKINDIANASAMYKSVLKRHRNDAIAKEANEKLNQL
jgi:TolA-binding protein